MSAPYSMSVGSIIAESRPRGMQVARGMDAGKLLHHALDGL
ncbi:MAG: hypothetical protein WB554_06650 [Desulfomonilaceae bacterium]